MVANLSKSALFFPLVGGLLLLVVLVLLVQNGAPSFPLAQPTQAHNLNNRDRIVLEANSVQHVFGNQRVNGFAYNNQFPGPLLKVQQGSQIVVDFKNNLSEPTTVHWHGLRLENQFDGVPEVTQDEVLPGKSFEYQLDFPDAGLFWYHPHVREDKQQELGLYGAILVTPSNPLPVMQEEVLILDDILLSGNGVPSFPASETNFAVMGRYGSFLLVNGKTDFSLQATVGKPVRLYLLNAANARPLRFAIEGARLKMVGSDVGFFAQPFWSDSVTLGPSERAIVEVFFERAGEFELQNATPQGTSRFGTMLVASGTASLQEKQGFESLRENVASAQELAQLQPFFARLPDFDFELWLRWPSMDEMLGIGMHGSGITDMHRDGDGIEWEDAMQHMNSITTSKDVTWILRDRLSGKENMAVLHSVQKGEVKKIRFRNSLESSHPMDHVVHLHGNRFVVLETDGVRNEHLVWKDSVLIPAGSTVDIVVEFSNPGDWMLHCHIAEHLGAGMMSMVEVVDSSLAS